MDVEDILGVDGGVSMDTCTVLGHILDWSMLMGRGMCKCSSEVVNHLILRCCVSWDSLDTQVMSNTK